jgi:hypothetical protein
LSFPQVSSSESPFLHPGCHSDPPPKLSFRGRRSRGSPPVPASRSADRGIYFYSPDLVARGAHRPRLIACGPSPASQASTPPRCPPTHHLMRVLSGLHLVCGGDAHESRGSCVSAQLPCTGEITRSRFRWSGTLAPRPRTSIIIPQKILMGPCRAPSAVHPGRPRDTRTRAGIRPSRRRRRVCSVPLYPNLLLPCREIHHVRSVRHQPFSDRRKRKICIVAGGAGR